jgi:hypothetical protein
VPERVRAGDERATHAADRGHLARSATGRMPGSTAFTATGCPSLIREKKFSPGIPSGIPGARTVEIRTPAESPANRPNRLNRRLRTTHVI